MSGDVRLRPFNLSLSYELWKRVRGRAKELKISQRALIRRAIVIYFEREDT